MGQSGRLITQVARLYPCIKNLRPFANNLCNFNFREEMSYETLPPFCSAGLQSLPWFKSGQPSKFLFCRCGDHFLKWSSHLDERVLKNA